MGLQVVEVGARAVGGVDWRIGAQEQGAHGRGHLRVRFFGITGFRV